MSKSQFPSDEVLKRRTETRKENEKLKGRELPTEKWYRIQKVCGLKTKYGPAMILTLEDRDGEIVKVWGCSGLMGEIRPFKGEYLCSHGLRKGERGQRYFSYQLATVKNLQIATE